MNKEEIEKAKEILKQPITVNCVDYKYFTQENYDKLISVYDNALWLLDIYEQVMESHQELKDRIDKANKEIKELYELYKDDNCYTIGDKLENVLIILKGDKQ